MTDHELAVLRDDPEMAELFLAEALEHLGMIEAALLALDEPPGACLDATRLNDIFRHFHTIKGNASALGVTSVEEVAHRVENLLDVAQSGRHTMTATDLDVVMRAVDVLTSMMRDVSARLEGQPPTELGPAARSLIVAVDRCIIGGAKPAMVAVSTTLGPSRAANARVDPAAVTRRADENASLRVDSQKLDSLLDAVGELIIVQSLIQDDPALGARLESQLAGNLGRLKHATAALQRSAMALRTVSMRQAFQKASRVVHDTSRKADKSVELVLAGEDIELDRKVVQELTDPIMHMVRNSIDHGIEMADVRVAAGKRGRARVTLSVYPQGGQVVIEIADDGKGLDTDKIKARAIECGLITADASPSQDEIHLLIFEPGFSTADTVTEISGRGVGMDVVRRNIVALGGRVVISSERGTGTTFQITLPLTTTLGSDTPRLRNTEDLIHLPAAARRLDVSGKYRR